MTEAVHTVNALRGALERKAGRHREELARLIEIPSVSTEGRGIEEAATAVAGLFESRELEVELHRSHGNPVIVARGGAADGPTLLFYEHYDVQPADPLDEWSVPAFELTEREGRLYGRGVADTKGHLICRLAAIDALREVLGHDPVRYVFVVEGEEEIGSPNLDAFVEEHAAALRADACLWESGGVDTAGRPIISLGLKGIVSLELHARGPAYDAHSSLGAAIDNPLFRLAAAIGSLRDADGTVLIGGFYDDVTPPAATELDVLAAQPDRTEELRQAYGVERFLGDAEGMELRRRLETEPALNVNGIHGGYGGPGTKTVLPAHAMAKLDIRLVPHQRPDRIVELLRAHLERAGFGDLEVRVLAAEGPGRTPFTDPFVTLVCDAARDAFGVEPIVHISSAGTGPVQPFREVLDVPFALCGCAYPGSRIHAPDEHIRIEDFTRATIHTALICERLGSGR